MGSLDVGDDHKVTFDNVWGGPDRRIHLKIAHSLGDLTSALEVEDLIEMHDRVHKTDVDRNGFIGNQCARCGVIRGVDWRASHASTHLVIE